MGVVIFEDKIAYGVVSEKPINKYHILVIPRQHFEAFVDLPDNIASHIFLVAKRVSAAVRRVCNPDAVSHLSDDQIAWKGFNQVAHYKLHVIPRFKKDKVEINWHRQRDPGLKARAMYAKEVREALTPQ